MLDYYLEFVLYMMDIICYYLDMPEVKFSKLILHLTFKWIHLPQVQLLFSVVGKFQMNLSRVVINLTSKMSPLAGSAKSSRC